MAQPSETYLSNININQLFVTGEHFSLSSEPPKGNLDINVQVSNPSTTSAKSEDGSSYLVQVTVGVHASLTEPSDGAVRVEASVDTFVVATMPQGVTGEQESYRRMRVEAVDAGYEFGRARIAELAALSPVGHLNLPSVDPERVVAHIAQDDKPVSTGNHVLEL